MIKFNVFFLFIFFSLSVGCKQSNKSSIDEEKEALLLSAAPAEDQTNIGNIKDDNLLHSLENLTCEQVLSIIQSEGTIIESLGSNALDSDALDYITLYQYGDINYMVVQFTSSYKRYIYCDINQSSWDAFTEDGVYSYGKSFHKHLAHYGCDCIE